MVLMACSSVFQLYVAIIIKKSFLKDKKVDLVLTNSSKLFKKVIGNAKLNELFNSVKFCPINKNYENLSRLKKSRPYRIFYELFPNRYVKKVWGINIKKYKESFFSAYTRDNILLQQAIKKKHKKAKLHVFEDGISTYLLADRQKWNTPSVLKKLFNIRPIESLLEDAYVFEPKIVCLDCYKQLVTIPRPQEVDGMVELLNDILGKDDYKIKEKFIFFEESFNNDGYVTNDAELINQVWSWTGEGEFVLKHHPRNRQDRFKEKLPTVDAPIFWENYLINNDIDDKVLIAVSSNTLFAPHIIVNSKPNIVFLYKIFNGTSPILGSGNFENYVERYLEVYSGYARTNVHIPETVEELKELILKFKKEEK